MRKAPLWAIWTAVGAVLSAAFAAVGLHRATGVLLYAGMALSPVVAVLVGVRRHRPAYARVWFLLLAGHVLNAASCFTYLYLCQIGAKDAASYADAVFIAGYVPHVAAVLGIARLRTGGRDRAGLIDAALLTTGMALLSWTFLMRPVAADPDMNGTAQAIGLAYPVLDVLLLAALIRMMVSRGARTTGFRLLAAAVSMSLLSDLAFAVAAFHPGVHLETLMSTPWLIAWVLHGAAALHPSMRSLTEPAGGTTTTTTLSGRRLALLTGVSLLAPALLVGQGVANPHRIDWPGIAAGLVVLFLLVLARMSGLVRQVRVQSTELAELAHQDALTGVPNRRSWDTSLEAALHRAGRGRVALHVAVLDLDHFKRFNDEFGHQAGDRLLKEAAAAWTGTLRRVDLLARRGGEEFGLLVTGESDDQLMAILARVRRATPRDQTFSAGVARWNGTETAGELVDRADQARYEAKRRGRDRAVLATTPRRTGATPHGLARTGRGA